MKTHIPSGGDSANFTSRFRRLTQMRKGHFLAPKECQSESSSSDSKKFFAEKITKKRLPAALVSVAFIAVSVFPAFAVDTHGVSADEAKNPVITDQAIVFVDPEVTDQSLIVDDEDSFKTLDDNKFAVTSDKAPVKFAVKSSALEDDPADVLFVLRDAPSHAADKKPTLLDRSNNEIQPTESINDSNGKPVDVWRVPGEKVKLAANPRDVRQAVQAEHAPGAVKFSLPQDGNYRFELLSPNDVTHEETDHKDHVSERVDNAKEEVRNKRSVTFNVNTTKSPERTASAQNTADKPVASEKSTQLNAAMPAKSARAPFSDAPQSTEERQILSKVHTDAISAYVLDGKLVAATKADVGADLGKRYDPNKIIFNIEPASKIALPGTVPSWLGKPGQEVWWAGQTWSNPEVIWPGFSTEDPALVDAVGNGQIRYTLSNVVGPGSVNVFVYGEEEFIRWFSSDDGPKVHDFPTRTHAHANWVFSHEGRYELTFTMSAKINGKAQTTHSTYVFYVGDTAHLSQPTQTQAQLVPQGNAKVKIQASVSAPLPDKPGSTYTPTGQVEFFKGAKGTEKISDMTSVDTVDLKDGVATSAELDDSAGDSVFKAVFHPHFVNEFKESISNAAERGVPDLSHDRLSIAATAADGSIHSGDRIQGTLEGAVPDGDYALWLRNTKKITTKLDEKISVRDKKFTATLPKDLPTSSWYKLAVTDADKNLWWAELTILGSGNANPDLPPDFNGGGAGGGNDGTNWNGSGGNDSNGGDANNNGGPSGNGGGNANNNGGPSGNGGGAGEENLPPSQNKENEGAQCKPEVTLDWGHIDAWDVRDDGDGIAMELKEDATSQSQSFYRVPESVVLKVKEKAFKPIPAGLPGGPGEGYVLPLTQDYSLIWPGWDTNRTKTGVFTDVKINITGVEGPGDVYMYSLDTFMAPKAIFDNGSMKMPGTIHLPTPAHTHAQWTFTKKGIYKIHANAVGTNPETGATAQTRDHTYVFQVGDVDLGNALCNLNTSGGDAGGKRVSAEELNRAQAASEAKAEAEEEKKAKAEEERKNVQRKRKAASKKKVKVGAGRDDSDEDEELAGKAMTTGGGVPPIAYAALGGGSVALAGGIALGTIALIKRRNANLLGRPQ